LSYGYACVLAQGNGSIPAGRFSNRVGRTTVKSLPEGHITCGY